MKLRPPYNPLRACLLSLPAFAALSLTGCTRIVQVRRTTVAPHVLDATLSQLQGQLAAQSEAIQSLTASIDLIASTGGAHEGQVKENPAFAGYIFLRKPADLRVLMLLPVVRSRALDMVSDGTHFKLLIPPRNKAVVGNEVLAKASSNGLENLRPPIIRDALVIPTVTPDEYVTLTMQSRLVAARPGQRENVEEPEYDLTVLKVRQGQELERIRVVRFSRVTLKPFQQDIYDPSGRIVTTVAYGNWQRSGSIDYPFSIVITRPVDEYKLQINLTKLQINPKLDDEEFVLKIPDTVTVQTM